MMLRTHPRHSASLATLAARHASTAATLCAVGVLLMVCGCVASATATSDNIVSYRPHMAAPQPAQDPHREQGIDSDPPGSAPSLLEDAAWVPFQWDYFGDMQLFSPDAEVIGVRLNLLGGGFSSHVHGIDVGLLGRSGGSDGIALNLLANQVDGESNGLQLAFVNVTERASNGLQLGLFNQAEDATGLQIAAIANQAHDAVGVQVALFNGFVYPNRLFRFLIDDDSDAATFEMRRSDIDGIQLALSNDADDAHGAQIALLNLSQQTWGAQLGALNYAEHRTVGIQLGVFNCTQRLHGLQLGLLNRADNGLLPWMPFFNFNFSE